jgi:hypothetical protein
MPRIPIHSYSSMSWQLTRSISLSRFCVLSSLDVFAMFLRQVINVAGLVLSLIRCTDQATDPGIHQTKPVPT